MNWLSSFYLKHPEYRKLRVAKKTPTSIHFELEPGLYEAHFQIRPIYKRAGRVWLPPEFAALGRLIGASVRNPRVALNMALALPFATVLTLQPDAAAGKDAWGHGGAPDTNFGNSQEIYTTSAGANNGIRGYIQFNYGLPTSATISAVSMILSVFATGNDTLSVYRILPANDWVELELTANVRKALTAWTGSVNCGTSGTDYDSTASASLAINAIGDKTLTFTAAGIADVQSHVSGTATNNGFLLVWGSFANACEIRSSDYVADPTKRPQFVITYTLPAGGGVFNPPLAAPFRGPFG